MDFRKAYATGELYDILDANQYTPDDVAEDHAERLVEIAQQRADARGEENALDGDQVECLIGTDWQNFASNEFGYDGGTLNNWALGVFNEDLSSSRNATLFSNAVVVQSEWLQTGDDRKTKIMQYEDDEYEDGKVGELWIPDGALDYIGVFELTGELIHGEPSVTDAM